MAFLHTRDPCIVHRDLKPANVLLDQNKDCKVADFGLSRDVTDSNRDFTQNIGTIAYMPPEALETSQSCGDEPKHCSEDSELLGTKWDVYSYAIMYLYILTGQRPYRGLDNRQIMLYVFVKRERPTIPDDTLSRAERQLAQDMWKTDLRKRPSFQNILERQYAMYRRNSEVKILQTPAKKINMTKEHLLGNAQPYLELTSIKKATPPKKPAVRNSAPVIGLPPVSFPVKRGARRKRGQRGGRLPKTHSHGALSDHPRPTPPHAKLKHRKSSSADDADFASITAPKLKSAPPPPYGKPKSISPIPEQEQVAGPPDLDKKSPKKTTSQLSLLEN